MKAEVESHDNKFHPTGGEMLGGNLQNACVRARSTCATLPILLLTPTVLSEL